MLLGRAVGARADQISLNGTELQGKVSRLSAAGITFELEDATGSLLIRWEKLDNIKTDGPLQVLYGEGQEIDSPLQGFSDGKLMAGATAIDVSTIQSGTPIGREGPSFNDRMRSAWRYWHGYLDAGLNVQQATTDTTGFLVGLQATRTKDPTRFTLWGGYRYGTQKRKGEASASTQDQLLGLARGEYDFTSRLYGFASGDATYDGIQRLSLRAVPKAGLGYKLWEEKLDATRRNFLQVEAGGSWVYEKYFGGSDNDYYAIGFGALGGYSLPLGARFDWRLDYLPAVDNFTSDYLLRTEAGLAMPVIDPLSAKLSLLDDYDNTPSPGANRNSLYLTVGLSIGW